ncbi:hypothetical protein E4U45_000153 [Claviceps purpurea]|nr:hypothetical protein E4U45_000153 [Claviceps purpurea]
MHSASLPRLPLFEAISKHEPESTAVIHSASGRRFTYGELLGDVCRAGERFVDASGKRDLQGERIAFLVENSYDYVVTLLAALAARAIAVPMSPAFPDPELQYILDHSQASLLVSSSKFASQARQVLAGPLEAEPRHLELPKHVGGRQGAGDAAVTLEGSDPGRAGLMLYTSGTTSKPKGVLIPQSAVTAQAHSLVEAWEYAPSDHLLHVLPLHHIHGTINAVITPLFAGSSIEFMFPFNPNAVWTRLAAPFLPADGDAATAKPKVTFFTVVPTVYSRLLSTHKSLPPDLQQACREAVSPQNMRVNISGSAALPTPIKSAWHDLSHGNVLLERYGMTEVGMALSCGLDFSDRIDASVGWPLPSVQARLMDVDTNQVIPPGQDLDPHGRPRSGEIQLRGPTIFQEYWRNPEATASAFVSDPDDTQGPWFKTGDVAIRQSSSSSSSSSSSGGTPSHAQSWTQGPPYYIQGRLTADIIKTGGEKVSALEVERELLSLPQVLEAAVVAIPSAKWGQKVAAVVVLDGDVVQKWSPLEMRRALKPRLANYKIPQVMKVVGHIPRNAMGKINKKKLVKEMFPEEQGGD